MVLKRQLPSRVTPDSPAGTPAANINEQWPAPIEPAGAMPSAPQTPEPAAFAPTAPELPPLPPLPAAFEVPAKPAAAEVPPAPPADTTPSLPSDDTPRRRVKAPREFAAPAEAETAMPLPQVENPVAEAPERLAEAGIITPPPADPITATLPPAPPSVAMADELPPLPPAPVSGESIFALPPEISAPLPEPTSDLPWAQGPQAGAKTGNVAAASGSDGGWDIDTVAAVSSVPVVAQASASASPPPDVFRDVALSRSPAAEGPMPSMPWSGGAGSGSGRPPPELPKSSINSTPRGGSFQLILAAAAVAGVLFVAYTLVTRTDSTQERLARLTGSLREAPEVVPGSPSSTNPMVRPNLQPEKMIAMNGLSNTLLPPPLVAGGQNTFMPLEPAGASPTTVVDFSDVPPGEAGKPIVADGSEKMPEDVSFMASLQQAIAKEKAKNGQPEAIVQAEAAKGNDKNLTPEQKLQRGQDLKAQLDEELAAYRKALADSPAPALAPKPTEFFRDSKQFMDGKATASVSGSVLLPPQSQGGNAVSAKGNVEGLPPAELYANNPKNLPILPEPAAEAPPKIRQISDFDVNVFEPEMPKVRMPKGVKPNIAAGDFPALDILSLVPGRGLIAYYEGKEGVLLVGEQVAGWKLVAVNATSAEFASGQKHQRVRPD